MKTDTDSLARSNPEGTRDEGRSAAEARPLTCASLHAAAAQLTFRATARDHSGAALGVLVDASGAPQQFAVAADGAWSLSSGRPSSRQAVLLYESAANVLRGGSLNANGTISYAGGDYVIQPGFDGQRRTAKLGSV